VKELVLDSLKDEIAALKDKVVEINVVFTGLEESAEAVAQLEKILAVINDLELGVTALNKVMQNLPDFGVMFDDVDFTGPSEEFAKVAIVVISLFNGLQQVSLEIETFAKAFENMEKMLTEIDKVALDESSKAWVSAFDVLTRAMEPLGNLFFQLSLSLSIIVSQANASEEAFEIFTNSISDSKADLEEFQEKVVKTETSLENISTYLFSSADGLEKLNTNMSESEEPFKAFVESSKAIIDQNKDFTKALKEITDKFKAVNPNIATAALNFANLLLPINAMYSNKMFEKLAKDLGGFSQKISDSQYNLEKLRDKMTKTADASEKLLTKLEALTKKTWNIDVVYTETKN